MLICTVAVWATQGHEPLRPMEAPAQKWPMCCQPSLPGRLLAGLLGGAGRVSRYGQSLRPAHLLPKLLSTDSLALTSVQGGCRAQEAHQTPPSQLVVNNLFMNRLSCTDSLPLQALGDFPDSDRLHPLTPGHEMASEIVSLWAIPSCACSLLKLLETQLR